MTYLITRTDHPKFSGSEDNVSSSPSRVEDPNVLESMGRYAMSGECCLGIRMREYHTPAKPMSSNFDLYSIGQYAIPYTRGPKTGPRPASSTPKRYLPLVDGVGE